MRPTLKSMHPALSGWTGLARGNHVERVRIELLGGWVFIAEYPLMGYLRVCATRPHLIEIYRVAQKAHRGLEMFVGYAEGEDFERLASCFLIAQVRHMVRWTQLSIEPVIRDAIVGRKDVTAPRADTESTWVEYDTEIKN